jgi:methyl-accepting chemotaxis protein
LFKNVKIRYQIVIISFLLVLISVASASIAAIRYFNGYTMVIADEEITRAADGFEKTVSDKVAQASAFRDKLIEMPALARLMSERDSEGIYDLTKPLMDAAGIDVLAVGAADGVILARPHDKKKIGDNMGNNPDAKIALGGSTYEMFLTAPSTKLGYYCGGPVRFRGEIVGWITAALSLENQKIVEELKTLFGSEAIIFADKTSINSTLRDNGKVVIGTEAPQDVVDRVLKKGERYTRKTEILNTPYLVRYSPIQEPRSGRIVGMLFTGKSLIGMSSAIASMMTAVGEIALIVLAFAFAVSFWLARRISKPLNRIVLLSERVKDGDLTITEDDFNYHRGDEFQALVKSLLSMLESQRNAISQVISTSNVITEYTGTLNSLAQENSDAMHRTREFIGEVSLLCEANTQALEKGNIGIAEMAQGANSVAKMSIDSAESLAKTTQMSKDAAESVNNLIGQIRIVDEKTLENQNKIKELSDSVSEISSFMNVIQSIADQTNLLALNAAIEAARAGDAGRGFAVVADEVRKLAEESHKASESVKKLVTALSKSAKDTISATEESAKIVKRIMSMANVAVTGLNEIAKTNEAIQSIAAVAQEQAAGSAEISNAIDAILKSTEEISQKMSNLNDLSNQASAAGNSTAEAAKEIYQSAEEMKEELSLFKIE